MNWSEEEIEHLVDGICRELYITNKRLSDYPQDKWQKFVQDHPELASRICESLVNMWANMWEPTFKLRLRINTELVGEEQNINIQLSDFLDSLWRNNFVPKLKSYEVDKLRDGVYDIVKRILQVVASTSSTLPNDSVPIASSSQKTLEVSNSAILKDGSQPQETKANLSAQNPHISTHEIVNKPSPSENDPTPPTAQWKYLPIPNDELDRHDEHYSQSGKSPEGLKLIGARVRGKMHKHNGTNCDDWFEFAVSGAWTIIAVSDGAGSKKFSRVGAKVSCQAAVYDLAEKLKAIEIKARETKEALQADLGQEADWAFTGKDIDSAQNALHEAMKVAYDAVNKKAEECDKLKDYYKALGNRDIDIKDFSATLLLAVHTTIKVGETQYSLVLTCQVGDGILAAISKEGTLKLLGKPDSGQFAGQTEFLTSKKKLDRENLIKKTFVFPGNLKALMVMTDGVADDYFPNDPQILELYGDLVLNQVIGIHKSDDAEISEKLRATDLGSLAGVKDAKKNFQVTQQAITPDETKDVKISYVDAYAKELGVSPQDVVASSALLWAGATGEPMCDECKDKPPEEKLRIWLDSYYHRGSFDDRTLVVLYREEV